MPFSVTPPAMATEFQAMRLALTGEVMVATNWIFSPTSMSRFMTMRKPVIEARSAGASPHASGVQPAGASFIEPPTDRTSPRQGLGTVEYWIVISEAGTVVISGSRP
ncbi:Uncharacterised protein [Mycobacteroides abscessus subsp. abscessus]|nr:Uncharacterised protein [Mycobacteroides abscessus subsp. abscessus]